MKRIVECMTLCLLCICTGYMGFAQTKIDTVYVKYSGASANTTKDSAFYYRVRTVADGVLIAEDYNIKDSMLSCSAYYKSFDPYVKQGHCIYYSNDTISSEGEYLEDKQSGIWKKYYSSGELWYTETKNDGERNGLLKGYYKTGEIKRIEEYENDKRIAGKCYTKSGEDTAYYEMYIMPVFSGGEQAKIDFIKKHIIYPKQARLKRIEGTSYVSFVITEDGSVKDVKIFKGKESDELLDAEAVRCVKSMPDWTPGYIDGIPAKVKLIQKIKFTLQE